MWKRCPSLIAKNGSIDTKSRIRHPLTLCAGQMILVSDQMIWCGLGIFGRIRLICDIPMRSLSTMKLLEPQWITKEILTNKSCSSQTLQKCGIKWPEFGVKFCTMLPMLKLVSDDPNVESDDPKVESSDPNLRRIWWHMGVKSLHHAPDDGWESDDPNGESNDPN